MLVKMVKQAAGELKPLQISSPKRVCSPGFDTRQFASLWCISARHKVKAGLDISIRTARAIKSRVKRALAAQQDYNIPDFERWEKGKTRQGFVVKLLYVGAEV